MGSLRRRISIDGRMFGVVSDAGPAGADAPVFVLLHGIGMSHRYLARLHRRLAAHGPVASVDLPGFGGLPKPPDDLDIGQMAQAIAGLLPAITEHSAVIVGHSMGAQWAVELARIHPEKVKAVVAIGPVVDSGHRTLGQQALGLAVDTMGETPRINTIVFTDYLRCGVPWYLAQARHMLTYPTEERVRGVAAPILIIRGGDDPVAGRHWCRLLRDSAPVSRLVEVPGHHHVVQESAPRAVADAIARHTVGTWPMPLEYTASVL